MKRFWWLGAVLLSLAVTYPAKGGGIVQEMNIAPPNMTKQSASNTQSQVDPTTTPPKTDNLSNESFNSKQKQRCGVDVHIEELASERSTRISWQGHKEKGKAPVKYLIYRQKDDGSWELIGEVDGGTFSFTDRNLSAANHYSYRIVAVYELEGGLFQKLQYPIQSIALRESLAPQMGVGCQATPWQQTPSLLLLLLLLPLLVRRRQLTP